MSRSIRAAIAALAIFTVAFDPATVSALEPSTDLSAMTAQDDRGIVTIGINGNEINIWRNGQIMIFVVGQGMFIFYPDGTYIDNNHTIHFMPGEIRLAYTLFLISYITGQFIIP
jgi:hypothetical protein